MSKAVSFSLFGYDRERQDNCFSHESYVRGLHINIRLYRLLFNGWDIVLNIDEASYNSRYRPIYDWHQSHGFLKINLFPNGDQLCKAMLRRMQTVFMYDHPNWKYTHVICRDLDSVPTYRERQMVEEWIEEDKALHCITDSVSHTIPMMGGMVGFRPGYVNDIMRLTNNPPDAFESLISLAPMDFRQKGSDQDFLNRVMYPKLCTNATEHFIKGRPHDLVEGNGRHYSVPDKSISDKVNPKFTETNYICGHVGSSGFYEAQTMKFMYWEDPYRDQYKELETMPGFETLFYWQTREDLR